MSGAEIALATLRFVLWEGALFGAALFLVERLRWQGVQKWLGVLALEITLESSIAGAFSFARANSEVAYWVVAAVCALGWLGVRFKNAETNLGTAGMTACATLLTPLVVLAFRPVEEIDSINYLHYLIEWMGNRATPFTFATNYVAFWELSFLPAWMVTRVDLFFPLIAAKAVLLLGLALWLVGEELQLDRFLRLAVVFGTLTMRHFWFEYSGVPTLKNDALHGVGFVLMALAVLRAARGKRPPVLLIALGVAFASVKYTGVFLAVPVLLALLLLRAIDWKGIAAVAGVFLVTAAPYYLRSLIESGSPFYPFQINLGPIHLPGTADLSYSSILYNLNDPRLWRAFFWPTGGVSPAGLLFPLVLAATLVASIAQLLMCLKRRGAPAPLDWTAFLLLTGWVLYFRSVFSATGAPGALSFILNNLNSVRYVDGVLGVSELFLAALQPAIAIVWVAIQLISRLWMLYVKVPIVVLGIAVGVGLAVYVVMRFVPRIAPAFALAALIIACPFLVEWNRATWTTYWNDLKPALAQSPPAAILLLEDGGYFAGHVVAAGNPVNRSVATVSLDDLKTLHPASLAVLVSPGSEVSANWKTKYLPQLETLGYHAAITGVYGAVLR